MEKYRIRTSASKAAKTKRSMALSSLQRLPAEQGEAVLKASYETQEDGAARAAALDLRLAFLLSRLRRTASPEAARSEGQGPDEPDQPGAAPGR